MSAEKIKSEGLKDVYSTRKASALNEIVDMYDVEIIRGVHKWSDPSKPNLPAPFSMINMEVVGKIGWLKEADLRNRLSRLSGSGLLRHHLKEREEGWLITEKGLDAICEKERT